MRIVAAFAVTACLSAGAAPPAHAASGIVVATYCGFSDENFRGAGDHVGEIDGGTAIAGDLTDPSGNPVTVQATCSLQLGGTGLHTDPDIVTASATGAGAVTVPPTPFRFSTPPGSVAIWSCTAWTLTDAHGVSTSYYSDSASGELSTDPATAQCDLGVGCDCPPDEVCDIVAPACWVFGKDG